MKRKKGFTLIELLVVIAIIALLLSILMPSLKKVKQIARDVICRSNLRQWSLIWSMYTNDHDGKFPTGLGTGYTRGQWINTLREEIDTNSDFLRCPSALKYKDFNHPEPHGGYKNTYKMGTTSSGQFAGIQEECSYGMNTWAYSKKGSLPGDDSNFWKTINVRGGNMIPLFMDSMWRGGSPDYTDGDGEMIMPAVESEDNEWSQQTWRGGIRQFAMPRHGNGAKAGINVLFFDASTRYVQIKELWTLKWHRNFETNRYKTEITWPTWMDKYTEP